MSEMGRDQEVVSRVRYLTHPEVEIDPNVPVPLWTLSAIGRKRVHALAHAGWLAGTTEIIASGEPKAIETAEILAAALGLAVEVREAMHENDRAATCYLPPPQFEVVASHFFAAPGDSVRGWEPARAAQARLCGRWRRCWNGPREGMCSLWAMAPLARCCSAIILKWQSAGRMIRPLAGGIISRSSERPARSAWVAGHGAGTPWRRLTGRSSDLGRWPPGAGSYAFWSDACSTSRRCNRSYTLESLRPMFVPSAGTLAAVLGRATEFLPVCWDQHRGHGSHPMPSPSRSWRGQYPGCPLLAGARPTMRAASQLGEAAMCFTVAMAENGLRLKIAAIAKAAMVLTAGHLLTR